MDQPKVLRVKRIRKPFIATNQPAVTGSDNTASGNVADDLSNVNGIENPVDTAGDSGAAIDPASIGSTADEQPKKRRGRPVGSGGGSKRTKQTPQNLGDLLYSLHLMGAQFLKISELAISQEEAEQLGTAIARVNDYYGVPVIPESIQVWLGLGAAAAQIYGPRLVAFSITRKLSRQKPTEVVRMNLTPQNIGVGATGMEQ